MKTNYSLFNGCTFGSDPSQDPCLDYWEHTGHTNLYGFGTSFDAITTKSSPDLPAPNVLTYFAPAFFRGFFRGYYLNNYDTHNSRTLTSPSQGSHKRLQIITMPSPPLFSRLTLPPGARFGSRAPTLKINWTFKKCISRLQRVLKM